MHHITITQKCGNVTAKNDVAWHNYHRGTVQPAMSVGMLLTNAQLFEKLHLKSLQ